MGLLDAAMSAIGGNTGGASPIMGVLASLLGGGQSGNTNTAGSGQGTGGMAGGLQGLLSKFSGAGLGGLAQSWVGNGPNQSVSPEQLNGVLGQDHVQSMAQQSGMAPHDFLSQLSQHLPTAVDKMTPNGKLPDEGSVSV